MYRKSKYIYLVVDNDKYELPFDFGSSPKELADRLGIDRMTVSNGVNYSGRNRGYKFVKVEDDGDVSDL